MAVKQTKYPPKNGVKRPKQEKKNETKQKDILLKWILRGLGALLLASIVFWLDKADKIINEKPDFDVKSAVVDIDKSIVIVAKNASAREKDPLNVRWDGVKLDKKAIPHPNRDTFEWTFSLKDTNLPKKYKKEGEHFLKVGFDGQFVDDPIKIVFDSMSKNLKKNHKIFEHPISIGTTEIGDNKIIQIKFTERLNIDPNAELYEVPKSFCITGDDLFLFPDSKHDIIKIFKKKDKFLKYEKNLGPKFGKDGFLDPTYCFYKRTEGKLEIIDGNARKVFVFDKVGYLNFKLKEIGLGVGAGYDRKFTKDGKQLIISGLINSEEYGGYGLYSLDIKSGDKYFMLTLYEKYGLKNAEQYDTEFFAKQTIPAIGVKAFFDISEDDLFFVWQGALRIIKYDLPSKKIKTVFGYETVNYAKPDGNLLSKPYVNGDFKATWQEQENFSYITNIFATHRHVLLVYEIAKNSSSFRLQIYTNEGKCLDDVSIPGKPSRQMLLDKENYDLYAFSEVSGSETDNFLILKYKIKVKK